MKLMIKTAEAIEAERAQAQRNVECADALAFLASTDWMVMRQTETGKSLPDDIARARAAARRRLSDNIKG